MANDLVKFDFRGKRVRTVVIEGEPWFVAKDVCDILGIVDSTTATRDLEPEELDRTVCVSGGQRREMTIVSESGLYALVFKSRKPEAKEFRKWVTKEVLPQIRKTGSYALTPTGYIEALEALIEAEKQKQQLQIKLDESMEWYSIKRMEKLNPGKNFKWQVLKNKSREMEIPIKKTFDQNYGEVNVYHKDVWEALFFDTLDFE